MLDILPYIALAIFVLYMLVLTAFAWLIKTSQKLAAEPAAHMVSPDMMPSEIRDFSDEMIAPFAALGFEHKGTIRMNDAGAHLRNWVLVFTNPSTSDNAICAVMSSTLEGAEDIKTSFVEFSSTFSNGVTLDTSNINQLLPYPSAKTSIKTILPGEPSPARIYAIHKLMMEKYSRGATKLDTMKEPITQYIIDETRKGYEQQVERGILAFEQAAAVFVPTWKGAYTMAFMLMWPVTALRRALLASKAQQLLARI